MADHEPNQSINFASSRNAEAGRTTRLTRNRQLLAKIHRSDLMGDRTSQLIAGISGELLEGAISLNLMDRFGDSRCQKV